MLEKFHPTVRVLAQKNGAQQTAIHAFRKRFPDLPVVFYELFAEASEIEVSYKNRYLRLYGPEGSFEMDEAYHISQRIPAAITIGDNGGDAIVFMPFPKPGLYRVGYGALDPEELVYIAPSLEALLYRAEVAAHLVGEITA